MSDHDYILVMMAKLIDALLRKGTEQDGSWGFPDFREELREMQKSLADTDAVKNAPKVFTV